MGQMLSEPVKVKATVKESDALSAYGASSMQGWRVTMEDAHTSILKLPNRAPAPAGPRQPEPQRGGDYGGPPPPYRRDMYSRTPPAEVRPFAGAGAAGPLDSAPPKADEDVVTTAMVEAESRNANTPQLFDSKLHLSFYGVYDGHGGSSVAKRTAQRLHWKIAQTQEFSKGDYEAALKKGFLELDEELRNDPTLQHDPSGCTSVVVLVANDGTVYCANAGDSRCILCINGMAEPMSFDHKPGNEEEIARITKAGGFVEFGRVNGNLALSRAIGDFEFKRQTDLPASEQIVTALPDVKIQKPDFADEFLVLACDGIWDVLNNQQVADFVSKAIAEGKDLGQVCEALMERCVAPERRTNEFGGVGFDNMTVIVVALLRNKSYEDWASAIKARWAKRVQDLGYDPTIPPPPPARPISDDDSDGEPSPDGKSPILVGSGPGAEPAPPPEFKPAGDEDIFDVRGPPPSGNLGQPVAAADATPMEDVEATGAGSAKPAAAGTGAKKNEPTVDAPARKGKE